MHVFLVCVHVCAWCGGASTVCVVHGHTGSAGSSLGGAGNGTEAGGTGTCRARGGTNTPLGQVGEQTYLYKGGCALLTIY